MSMLEGTCGNVKKPPSVVKESAAKLTSNAKAKNVLATNFVLYSGTAAKISPTIANI